MNQFTKKKFTILAVVLGSLMVVPAFAKERCYQLEPLKDEHGKNRPIEPVCRVLEKNLNMFCDEPPMVCEFKIHPRFRGQLSVPMWRPLAQSIDMALLERFFKAPWDAVNYPKGGQEIWQQWQEKIAAAMQRGSLKIEETQLDFLNRGHVDPVWRVQTGDCTPENQATEMSDQASIYRTEGIEVNFAPEVFSGSYKPKALPVGEPHLFKYKEHFYSCAMNGSSALVNFFVDDSIQSIYNVCLINYLK